MMDLVLTAKLLLGAAACICIWFMVAGLIEMQRINAGAEDVVETQGVVRQLQPQGRYDSHAVLTLNVQDEVVHVDCILPGPWFGRSKYRVTDLVPVLWRRGDKRAIAVQTIRNGQRMFLIGVVGLAVAALMFVMLF